jgi:hypothetical protein
VTGDARVLRPDRSRKTDRLDKMAEYADADIPFYWLAWLSGSHLLSIDIHALDHTIGYYRPYRTLTPEPRRRVSATGQTVPNPSRQHCQRTGGTARSCAWAPDKGDHLTLYGRRTVI